MTTTSAARDILEAISMDIQRLARLQAIRTQFEQELERAGDLFTAGLWFESRNVIQQALEMLREAK